MDIFGIGAAVRGVVQIYFRSARQTGRTTTLVQTVKKGDRIIFLHAEEAKRVERLLRERELTGVTCTVSDPANPDSLFEKGTSQGRTIFDHAWVEEFYRRRINDAGNDLQYFADQLSGFGEAHYNTKRQAEELRRWQP